jgi:release factor glutamine methyltransferase
VSGLIEQLRAAGCVFADEEAALIVARFPAWADQEAAAVSRCAGVPLELVLGRADFAGVSVTVQPGVFVPRRRAEVLVNDADELGALLQATPDRRDPVLVLDLGCGSGALAAALQSRHSGWQVHACEIDPVAVECARANGRTFGFTVHPSDWFGGLPGHLNQRFDLIVAHLPYVPTADVPLLPRDYRAVEPMRTVDGGPDGLDPWRQVAAACRSWLAPTGQLLTQVTEHQADTAVAVGQSAGLSIRAIPHDDSVVIAAELAGHALPR